MIDERVLARRNEAARLDADDPLAGMRAAFTMPPGVVYLDGNSLGARPIGVPDALARVLTQWRDDLIKGWRVHGWWHTPLLVGDRIGRLLGAASGQTVVGDSASVQLFNALTAAARLRADRSVLLVDAGNFPTDRYMVASVSRLTSLTVRAVPMPELAEAIRETAGQLAVVAASSVDYRTGELWDMSGLTTATHQAGAVVLWDVCHAIGAMPLALDEQEVDFAVGCGYKFLSGGPGAPGFLYVARRHLDRFDQPLTGWHGHATPFDMETEYRPAEGIARARIGNPPILSLVALDAALDVFDGLDLSSVRGKSLALTDFFISCVDEHLLELGFEVVTPRDRVHRGSQVTLRHPRASTIMATLAEAGVVGTAQRPDLLRFGVNALYVSYADVLSAVETIRTVAAATVRIV
ncbi:kynureninase [Amycolatopsis speibonae]|uniref:Kynureninase n=1 Tax=Amycolatopsis speibonae TaxID=1450224 RepID=A0ABV7P0T2_9PSEU